MHKFNGPINTQNPKSYTDVISLNYKRKKNHESINYFEYRNLSCGTANSTTFVEMENKTKSDSNVHCP